MSKVEERLGSLGLGIPPVAAPVAAYVPAVAHNGVAYTAGQLPFIEGALPVTGKVGAEVTEDDAIGFAEVATLNALAALKSVLGDLDRITQVLKVNVFVASTPEYTKHPLVANGASELIGDVFGEIGAHARAAVGVAALPLDAPVEVELVVAYE